MKRGKRQGKIKIDWVIWRVRIRAVSTNCSGCLDYGHMSTTSRRPHRKWYKANICNKKERSVQGSWHVFWARGGVRSSEQNWKKLRRGSYNQYPTDQHAPKSNCSWHPLPVSCGSSDHQQAVPELASVFGTHLPYCSCLRPRRWLCLDSMFRNNIFQPLSSTERDDDGLLTQTSFSGGCCLGHGRVDPCWGYLQCQNA